MLNAKLNFSNLTKKLDMTENIVAEQALVMARQAAQIGVDVAQHSLDVSTTKTGEKRWSLGIGFSPGRNLTGSMINDLKILNISRNQYGITAKFGWSEDSYYQYQELGTQKIRGVFSLFDGRMAILNELPRLKANMLSRIRYRLKRVK
jgi:hypothetical protein